ncbi:MAG: hypothetical protein WB217_09225 [Mesobacillus sp.]|uniref:hypothetical protein n=1 Tax=Mesobacillus sp. TaxID=2675271 RepID=UPI003C5A8A2C
MEWKTRRLFEMLPHFFVRGFIQGSYSVSCGISWTDETPQTHVAASRLSGSPTKNLLMKKPAVGLYHNSSAESEAPGTEINSPISPPNKRKTVNKLDFYRVRLQSECRFPQAYFH